MQAVAERFHKRYWPLRENTTRKVRSGSSLTLYPALKRGGQHVSQLLFRVAPRLLAPKEHGACSYSAAVDDEVLKGVVDANVPHMGAELSDEIVGELAGCKQRSRSSPELRFPETKSSLTSCSPARVRAMR